MGNLFLNNIKMSDNEGAMNMSDEEPVINDDNEGSQSSDDDSSKNSSDSSVDNDDERKQFITSGVNFVNARAEPNELRITPKFMTKYERARVIGIRALQISKNAPVLIDLGKEDMDPILIAEKELNERKIPFLIRRYLPDGSFEDWKVSDLEIIDKI